MGSSLAHGLASTPVKSGLASCDSCAHQVLVNLQFDYRSQIDSDDLPAIARSRPSCWYGKNCRTQNHNPDHCVRYNHICEQVRLCISCYFRLLVLTFSLLCAIITTEKVLIEARSKNTLIEFVCYCCCKDERDRCIVVMRL